MTMANSPPYILVEVFLGDEKPTIFHSPSILLVSQTHQNGKSNVACGVQGPTHLKLNSIISIPTWVHPVDLQPS